MNRTIESALRFINLTAAGLLAGSLGFGDAALVPGWKEELPAKGGGTRPLDPLKTASYFNAIGPVALGTAVTLAIAAPRNGGAARRILDSASAVGLAGVLAATVMVTVPINTLLLTVSLFAQTPKSRTLVVRDGKVIHSENAEGLEGLLLGGPRAYLGVSLNNLTPELSEHFGGPKEAGVIVESVADNSPADKAGIRVGDIIISIDGKDVKSAVDIRTGLRGKKSGDTVRVEVQRGRGRQTIVATVAERETPRVLQLDELPGLIDTPEFRARVARLGD